MIDKINSWIVRIDNLTSTFESEFGNLSHDELNWKPGEQVWSIAQVIEHLINTNASYLPVIDDVKSDKYKPPLTAKMPGFPAFMGKTILKSLHPDNRKKTKTFKVWQPKTGKLPKDILRKFSNNQEQLKDLILSSVNLIENKTIISSPANKYIVYELETAFEILVIHEERHLIQAREVKSMMSVNR